MIGLRSSANALCSWISRGQTRRIEGRRPREQVPRFRHARSEGAIGTASLLSQRLLGMAVNGLPDHSRLYPRNVTDLTPGPWVRAVNNQTHPCAIRGPRAKPIPSPAQELNDRPTSHLRAPGPPFVASALFGQALPRPAPPVSPTLRSDRPSASRAPPTALTTTNNDTPSREPLARSQLTPTCASPAWLPERMIQRIGSSLSEANTKPRASHAASVVCAAVGSEVGARGPPRGGWVLGVPALPVGGHGLQC